MEKRAIRKVPTIQWKKKDSIAIILIISVGLILSVVSSSFIEFYEIYYSISVGLFFGGVFLSVVSIFLAQMESNITGVGDIDAEIDVDTDIDVDVDIDTDVDIDIDADLDIEIDADVDYDIEAEIDIDAAEVDVDVDLEAGVDVDSEIDIDNEAEIDTDLISTITPAPIMLLFSSGFLIFGISGILMYQFIGVQFRFIAIFIAPLLAYIVSKLINFAWKNIAKSRFYSISSTQNLLGIKGEVLLKVDERGGIIKIPSNTPLRFERVHVKPIFDSLQFERGDKVYICDVKDGYLLVDNNTKSIRKRR